MANPLIPGISATEQDLLYKKLSIYNQKKASFKEAGAYLVVLPRTDYPRYSLWVYSPPARKAIHLLYLRFERGCTRSLADSKYAMLLLPASFTLSGIQRQADAEQGRRHYLFRQISWALSARDSPDRSWLSHLDSF